MKFNKGAELDKQIYKEGDSTWGCKSGVLDVEDVQDFISEIKDTIISMKRDNDLQWNMRLNVINEEINKKVGEKLNP